MKQIKGILLLLIIVSAFDYIFLMTPVSYGSSDEFGVEDKFHVESKFESQLWEKIQAFQSNGTTKDLSLIIWLVKNERITGMQIGQLKNYASFLFTSNHSATVYSVLDVLPIVIAKVSAFEAEKIAGYEFVESIGDGNRIGYATLDVSRRAIKADDVETTYGYDGNGIKIAILDTGINSNHPDLDDLDDDPDTNDPKVIDEVSYVDRDDNGIPDEGPQDDFGHGTLVAGIAAGTGSQNSMLKGIAPGAWLLNIKVMNLTWFGDIPTGRFQRDDVINGIDHALVQGADVICMSLGEPGGDGTSSLSRAADYAVEAGVVVVTVAGNSGPGAETINAPGDAFNVITVGSVNDGGTEYIQNDVLASGSSRGPTKENVSLSRPKPDVVAPGVGIIAPIDSSAAYWQTYPENRVGSFYASMDGTSMAAPHVAGTAALMLNANPNLSPAQVKAILRQTAKLNTHLNGLGVNDRGHGIVDAYDAVELSTNVHDIPLDQMYDPFSVKTLEHRIDDWSADYLTFDVDSPNLGRGFSISSVNCHYGFLWTWTSHTLLSNLRAPFVWINGICYNLGLNLNEYLFSGPHIFALGEGYVWLRALFKVNGVMVKYESRMGVEGMGMSFFITISGASSQKTLISINPEIWDPSNFPQLRSTNEIIYYERKVTGDTDLNIRDLAHAEYLEIDQIDMDAVWIIRDDYTGNNPDSALNDEYTYNRDILVCYQGTSSNNVVWIYREPDGLPTPNPPPSNLATPDGPDGYSRQTYPYTTSSSSSGNTIHYEFDWGDGSRTWTDWYDSGATATAEHSWTYSGTYYVKVRAEDSNNAWSDWSESLTVTLSGMGCPTLYVWNGTDFIVDNNLLTGSAGSNGTEVEDYYRLEQDLVPFYEGYFNSYYSLLISEFQQEHSYLDEVSLFAVDHQANVSVAVSPTGEILTYQNPYAPITAVDEANVSWLDELSSIDSDYYESCNGSFLVLNFGEVNSSFAKFIVRADPPPDGPPTKKSIHIQVLNASESWVDVVSIIPRAYWATDIIDLLDYLPSEGELIVRLYFTDNHRVDFVGLDTTPQAEIDVEDAYLLLAYHSSEGFVTSELASDDDVYAELVPGQQITLLFAAAKPDEEARTFIFYVKGYYTITS